MKTKIALAACAIDIGAIAAPVIASAASASSFPPGTTSASISFTDNNSPYSYHVSPVRTFCPNGKSVVGVEVGKVTANVQAGWKLVLKPVAYSLVGNGYPYIAMNGQEEVVNVVTRGAQEKRGNVVKQVSYNVEFVISCL